MALEAFLKIEGPGVEGESQKAGHEGELDVLSYSWGVSNHGAGQSGTGSGSGQADFHDLNVTVMMQTGVELIFKQCASGVHFEKATLVSREAGGTAQVDYLKIEMEKVFITAMSFGASEGSGKPPVSIGLHFAKVNYIYTPQNSDGSAGAERTQSWDIAAGTA